VEPKRYTSGPMQWPELLTDEQVAEFLNIPFDPDHIRRLRSREKLPHVCFDVRGTKHYRYPLDLVRQWVRDRVRVGKRRISMSPRKT
jgi:hypothetical protein